MFQSHPGCGVAFFDSGHNQHIFSAGFPGGVFFHRLGQCGALHFFVQLGQLPAQGDGAVPQAFQQGGKGLPQAVGRFVEDKGMRQAANCLQRRIALPFFDGKKALK